MDDVVEVMCYGTLKKIERKNAIKSYEEGVLFSEGSEQDRYVNILTQLLSGSYFCSDEINSLGEIIYANIADEKYFVVEQNDIDYFELTIFEIPSNNKDYYACKCLAELVLCLKCKYSEYIKQIIFINGSYEDVYKELKVINEEISLDFKRMVINNEQ